MVASAALQMLNRQNVNNKESKMRQVFVCSLLCSLFVFVSSVNAQGLWKCPGNVYTNTPTGQQKATGCVLMGDNNDQVSVVPAPPPSSSAQSDSAYLEAMQQKRDAKKVQQAKLDLQKRIGVAEGELAALETEYNNGQPQRMGPEFKNYQHYLDRVERLKGEIAQKKEEVGSLKSQL